ncbi:MATE family efflux transporter [Paenibacillus chartarius]|uniref:MATE family efflux transporter n=1 Tax=Paenibacillus chartarius TaxID=747481 RepID=A0ABV6DH61_9BACL
MTKPEPNLSLWRLSWPIGIELLLQFLMGAVDTMMVSRIGDAAVSAAGLSNQVLMSGMMAFAVINAGAGVVISRKWGSMQMADARKAAILSIQFSLLAGLLTGFVFYCFAGTILSFLGTPAEVLQYGTGYLTIVGSCTVWTVLLSVMGSIIRSTGNTRGPMYISLGMNLVHVLLNGVLIFGLFGMPEMGLAGAAYSNVISRILACLFIAILAYNCFRGTWRLPEWWSLDRKILREMLQIGLPVCVTAVSWGYAQVIVSSLVSRMGADTLAAYTYMQTIQQLPWLITAAIGGAMQIQVGQLHGALRHAEAHASVYRAIQAGIGIVAGLSVLLTLGGPWVLGLFTANQEIIRQCLPALAVCIVWQPLRLMGYCSSNALNVVGNANVVAGMTVFGMWVLQAGGTYVIGSVFGLGLTGVFLAMLADEIVRMSVFMRKWSTRRTLYAAKGSTSAV